MEYEYDVKQANERLASLSRANINALSGTGCVNVWELRMAYDILRERLAIRYEDTITTKEILSEVTRRSYASQSEHLPETEQMVFDFARGTK